MTTDRLIGGELVCVVRGLAQALGLLASIPFVLFLFDSGTEVWPKLSWSHPQELPLFIVLTMATLGYLIAWRWERAGGATVVVCAVGIVALVYFGSGPALLYAALMISMPLFAAGVLFLACHWRTRREQFRQGA